jgi:hypothetical protein
MDEEEWRSCADPCKMLAYLEDRASERKLRLFSCACCRRVWHLLETDNLRASVEALERFGDGEIDEESFRASASVSHPLKNYLDEIVSGQAREDVLFAAYALNAAMLSLPGFGDRKALEFFALAARPRLDEERAAQRDLIHEVFGNPFRASEIRPGYLCWGEGVIPKLATASYDQRCLPFG